MHPASFVKPAVMPYEPTGQYGHAPPRLYVPNVHCALTISAFVKKHATKRVAIITPLAHVLFITFYCAQVSEDMLEIQLEKPTNMSHRNGTTAMLGMRNHDMCIEHGIQCKEWMSFIINAYK
jgi:hypothetical protein